MRLFILLSFLMSYAASAAPEKHSPNVTGLTVEESNLLFSGIVEIKTNDWENWGLTKEEWDKYLLIKEKTVWAKWDGNPSPLQLLAIYSRSPQEKQRYARIEARLDLWRRDVALDYQKTYSHEMKLIASQYSEYVNARIPSVENINPNERVLAFFNTKSGECDTRCRAVIKPILKTGANVAIYSIDRSTQEELFAWAQSADIPVDVVQSGQVTLNIEAGEFSQVTDIPMAFSIVPASYVKRGDTWVRVIQ